MNEDIRMIGEALLSVYAVFCSMRNGKIRKRFRGACEYVERSK